MLEHQFLTSVHQFYHHIEKPIQNIRFIRNGTTLVEHTRPSAAPDTNRSPSGEYRTTCTNFSWSDMVVFHLNGGPSKNETALSSLPVIARNGRVGLKSTELIALVIPDISPTELPASAENT